MKIKVIDLATYSSIAPNPFTSFDSDVFCKLNRHKVDSIIPLVGINSKYRFGLIVGIRDNEMLAPFSAPFSCISNISSQNKAIDYADFIEELINFSKDSKFKKIKLTLPPLFYDPAHIQWIINSLYTNGFSVSGADIAHYICLDEYISFEEDYIRSLAIKGRQKITSSLKQGLSCERGTDISKAYQIIAENRKHRGYPLLLKEEDLINISNHIKIDCFIVKSPEGENIASAIVYHIKDSFVQVIYWGNLPGHNDKHSMNFMAFSMLKYYSNQGVSFFDLGPSTDNSLPNFGLSDFKQSIGCLPSIKFSFKLDLK